MPYSLLTCFCGVHFTNLFCFCSVQFTNLVSVVYSLLTCFCGVQFTNLVSVVYSLLTCFCGVQFTDQWRIHGGLPPVHVPPTAQNVLNFMRFFKNLAKLYVGVPLEGGHPLLRGILDLTLLTCFCGVQLCGTVSIKGVAQTDFRPNWFPGRIVTVQTSPLTPVNYCVI